VEIATDNVTSNGDSRPVAGTSFTFDEDGIFTDGVITGNTGWRADQNGSDPRTPIYGLQSNNIRRDVDQTYLTSDYGFNFRWTPTDHWGVQFDYQHVDSKVDVLDVGIWGSTYQNVAISLRGEDAPIINFLPPSNNGTVANCSTASAACPSYYTGTHANFLDPYNSFWRSVMDHIEQSEGKEDAAKIDVEYKFLDNPWIDSVKGGARWARRDQTTRFSAYNWGVISEVWGSGGPVWFTDAINGSPTTSGGSDSSGVTEAWAFKNFFRGEVPVPTGDQSRLFYAYNIAQNYDAFSQFALSVGDEWRARLNSATGCPQNWVPLAQRCDTVDGTPFRAGEINPVLEDTRSAYGMVRFKHDFGDDVRLTGNLGLRYTNTKRESEGVLVFQRTSLTTPDQCDDAVDSGQTVSEFCQLPEAARIAAQAFLNGETLPNTAKDKYDYWLPSLNMKLQLPNKVQLRFGASKTITPPDLGYVRNYYAITLDTTDATLNADPTLRGIITVGNPYLRPTESFNLDFSAEWYFAPVGSLTFAVFNKELTNVLTNATLVVPYTNNGATFDVKVTTPINSDKTATVKGFEIGYQQFYDFLPGPLKGFGINANYSYIDSKGVPQSTLSNTDPDVGAGRIANVDTSKLPLQGLSKHNVNFAAIYEKGPISARLAYNWRSDFLLTVRDVIVPYAPIMNEATGQLDGSLFFTLSPKVKVGVQGVNLLNEVTRTTQVLNDDLLKTGRSWFMNDRRYTFVVRASF
ncbi:MAG: TonB-dependent receptor, partial [Caulobacter sp.]